MLPAARARSRAPSTVETTRPAKASASLRPTPSPRSAVAIASSQLAKAAVATTASAGSSGRAIAAAATGQPIRSGCLVTRRRKISPNIVSVSLTPRSASERSSVRRISPPSSSTASTASWRLAAGEVVVDRASRRVAALGHVAQLHPGVALFRQQLAGAVEQQGAAVAALSLRRLTVGQSRYAHGHSL